MIKSNNPTIKQIEEQGVNLQTTDFQILLNVIRVSGKHDTGRAESNSGKLHVP